MHHGERADDALVGQVGVEGLDLGLGEHSLVDDGARRQAREVGAPGVGAVLGALAQAEREALQLDAALTAPPGDEQLAERRHRRARRRADVGLVGVDGELAPAQDRQALLGGERVDRGDRRVGLGPVAVVRYGGQERRAHGVRAGLGELEVDRGAEERVRDLDEDARAVTGVGLGAARPAVFQTQQGGDRLADDVVGATTLEIGHHGDAAGVVLEVRGVEPLRGTCWVDAQQCLLVVSVHPDSWHRDDVLMWCQE